MTPIARLLSRWLPVPLRIPALALLYFGMAMAAFVASRHDSSRIIYVDVRGQ